MAVAASTEIPHRNSANYSILLAAIVIAYYAAWVVFWHWGYQPFIGQLEWIQGVYPVTDRTARHPYAHYPMPFIDLAGVISWRECFLQGWDVILRNPCDPINRGGANYSPLTWQLPWEWIGHRNLFAAGMALDAIFLTFVLSIMRPRTPREWTIAALAVVSPSVFFAMERANLDIAIFIVLLGTSLLPQKKGWARIAFYGACWAGALLKFYPIALMIKALQERPGRFAILALLSTAGALAFVFQYRTLLSHIVLPIADYRQFMFGAGILATGLQLNMGMPPWSAVIIKALCTVTSFAFMVVLARKVEKPAQTLGEFGRESSLLSWSATLVVACFFSGFNMYYRAIFLLPALPGMFVLARSAQNPATQKLLQWGLLGLVACLYADMFRYVGTALISRFFRVAHLVAGIDQNSILGRLFTLLLLVFKEALWWCEITFLGGILIALFGHARTVAHLKSLIPSLQRRFFASHA